MNWRRVGEGLAWMVAAAWVWKWASVRRGSGQIPDLLESGFDRKPAELPSLAVIVPARDEEADIEQTLRSLLRQEYPNLQIVAVNDRSTDGTGPVMHRLAAEFPASLRVVDIDTLPGGWLGKTHAMAHAAALTDAEYLLFTDADIVFRADALRRSMQCAVLEGADHFVTLPTTLIHRWDEGALLGFLQLLATWAVRLWKLPDPDARDAVGVGAFNMVRRTAYEAVGGFAALRMEVLEDLGLARRLKDAGFRSHAAFGKGLVTVHWASGAQGIVGVMTKNLFAAFRYRPVLVLFGSAWILGFSALPFAGLFWRPALLPGLVTLGAITGMYRTTGKHSGLSAGYALLTPVAAVVLSYALLRSMLTTLVQGGVRWRGTFYALVELRQSGAQQPKL